MTIFQTPRTLYLADALDSLNALDSLRETAVALVNALPPATKYEDDAWNIVSWKLVKGNGRESFLHFSKIKNIELRAVLKLHILYQRLFKSSGGANAILILSAIRNLDAVVPSDLPLSQLNNGHFQAVELRLIAKGKKESDNPLRLCRSLAVFGQWLNINLGLRISYKPSAKRRPAHGRHGTEEGRKAKLIPLAILEDLLAKLSDQNIDLRDRFFLHTVVILIATGFRINELLTLQANCLIDQEGKIGLRYWPEKRRDAAIKWIPSAIVPAVRAALEYIKGVTEPGRLAAQEIALAEQEGKVRYDWSAIMRNQEAAEYFFQKIIAEWTANPINNLLNTSGAWFERDKKYIDIISLLEQHNGNRNAVGRVIGTQCTVVAYLHQKQLASLSGQLPPGSVTEVECRRFITDSRFISVTKIEKMIGLSLRAKSWSIANACVLAAQKLQLQGLASELPPFNHQFEDQYRLYVRPVREGGPGEDLVLPQEALFIIEPYTIANAKSIKRGQYSLVSDKMFVRWLAGERRNQGDRGVKDSIFSRLGIKDPETGEVAKFISHDIRHWLTTIYLRGGLTQEQVAVLFGRDPGRAVAANDPYDQRSFGERQFNLRNAVRGDKALGHVAEVFIQLSKESREEAEQYLEASTREFTVMPHGMCLRRLRIDPCPNHLSCLSDQHRTDRGPCSHHLIDSRDEFIVAELKKLEKNQDLMLRVLPSSYPQHTHALNVRNNVRVMLAGVENSQSQAESVS